MRLLSILTGIVSVLAASKKQEKSAVDALKEHGSQLGRDLAVLGARVHDAAMGIGPRETKLIKEMEKNKKKADLAAKKAFGEKSAPGVKKGAKKTKNAKKGKKV